MPRAMGCRARWDAAHDIQLDAAPASERQSGATRRGRGARRSALSPTRTSSHGLKMYYYYYDYEHYSYYYY